MKSTARTMLSRRGLGSLLVAAPMAAQAVQTGKKSPDDEARQTRSANSARLKAVALDRDIEPSFRFEP